MTQNEPGSINQPPLYACAGCPEENSWPADHLRVYEGRCWCESCWDEFNPSGQGVLDWWTELPEFTPEQPAPVAVPDVWAQEKATISDILRQAAINEDDIDCCWGEAKNPDLAEAVQWLAEIVDTDRAFAAPPAPAVDEQSRAECADELDGIAEKLRNLYACKPYGDDVLMCSSQCRDLAYRLRAQQQGGPQS